MNPQAKQPKQKKKQSLNQTKKNPRKRWVRLRRILWRVLGGILALGLAAAFYLAVIMGQPDPKGVEGGASAPAEQALRAAEPAYQIQEAGQVQALMDQFPAPVLSFHELPGLTFLSGRSYDQAFEGGFARRLELVYERQDGQRVSLETIYPARAFDLMSREGYALATLSQTALAGQPAVVMTGEKGVRLHTQGEEAIYVLTAPSLTAEELAEITRATTLTLPLPLLMETYERGE